MRNLIPAEGPLARVAQTGALLRVGKGEYAYNLTGIIRKYNRLSNGWCQMAIKTAWENCKQIDELELAKIIDVIESAQLSTSGNTLMKFIG